VTEGQKLSGEVNVFVDNYDKIDHGSETALMGIHESVALKQKTMRTFFVLDDLLKALKKRSRKFVIVLSPSMAKMEHILTTLNRAGIHPIYINNAISNTTYSFSSVTPNFYSAMNRLTGMLLAEYPVPTAFIGYNFDSVPDRQRLDGFKQAAEESGAQWQVFSHHGDVGKNIDEAMGHLDKFQNIVCANDMIAILLLRRMKAAGVDPVHFNISGCGNTKTGQYFKPALTTMTTDYHNQGIMAVEIYSLLSKKRDIQNLSINLDCEIILRESTHLKDSQPTNGKKPDSCAKEAVDFYNNSMIKEIDTLEKMLNGCDEVDIDILWGLLKGWTYEKISEENSIAINTVKYRLRKIETNIGLRSRNELENYLREIDLNF
jgi:DNA-binding LacI/PurR family transcriptional regulator/DNA-binding CsgD family transcriptional regulator